MIGWQVIAAQHVAVFTLVFITDIFWARYNIASSGRHPWPAALWSAGIVLVGTFSTQIWLNNHWVLVSSALGALVGTYYAVRWGKKEESAPTVAPLSDEEILMLRRQLGSER